VGTPEERLKPLPQRVAVASTALGGGVVAIRRAGGSRNPEERLKPLPKRVAVGSARGRGCSLSSGLA